MSERTWLKRQQAVGTERKIAGYDNEMGYVNGGRDVHPGGGTHPGTNAGPVHAGVVMRRMLDFMRDGATGRHGQ